MWLFGILVLLGGIFFFATKEGYKSYKEQGMWQNYHGIFTTFKPADLNLYRKLLPNELDMPDEPAVTMFVVDYVTVVPFPMSPYLEGSVAIKCKYKGEDGWHVLSMPVTTRVANQAGRLIGYPKYVADKILLEKNGQSTHGIVRHQEKMRISLQYTPGLDRPLTEEEKKMEDIGARGATEPRFLLVPPAKGPMLKKITIEERVPAQWEVSQGAVKIHMDQQDPWAKLVTDNMVTVGYYKKFTGGNIMLNEKVN